jgi:hypothetical protein
VTGHGPDWAFPPTVDVDVGTGRPGVEGGGNTVVDVQAAA